MPKFIYKARDWSGKMVKGELEMGTRGEVIASVKEGGLVPIDVIEKKSGTLDEINKKFFSKITLKQTSEFTRQLSTMMTAGLALTDALSLLKNQIEGNTMMLEVIEHCLATVRGGEALGTALERYKSQFGEAYVASIKAGEEGGVLMEVLQKLADNLENENEFRGKVKGAMIYPVIVVIGMIIVAIIMMVFVIPKLMTLYDDFGSEMPAITRGLMSVSGFMAKTWFLFPLLAVGYVWFTKLAKKVPSLGYKKDKFKLKIPILGELTEKTIVANTMRTLSMLMAAGIPLVDAIKIVADVSDNEVYRKAFVRIAERVQKGFSISNSFEETGVFPVIVNQMISTGEATGKLDEILMRVSNYFSTEAEQSVKSLTSAIEPLIMIVLGIGVGFLVVAVIMPIYNLTSQF